MNNYAISTSDLAESLTRSSAALVAANNSLEQSIAMTTAANTTIQDPESVGNALKTVSMRIRGVKTELEEAGEDTEGMVTNTAKLQEKIMALTNIDGSGGVDILTRSGDFKSTYDILLEISKVWKDMGDVEQAALLELVAGKTRGSVVAALFQNGEVLEKAYKSATDASGSAMRELENHLDSIQGRIDLFNNAVQTMWMNFINADFAKFIVNLGTWLIQLVDKVGLLNTAIVGLGAGMFVKHKLKENKIDLLDFIFDVAPEKIKNSSFVKNFATTVKTATTEALKKSSGSASAMDVLAEIANYDYTGDLVQAAANQWALNDANLASIQITRNKVKALLQEQVAQNLIDKETAEAILANIAFATSEGVVTSSTLTLSGALSLLWAKVAGLAKGIWALIVQHPYITALVVAVAAVGAALTMSGKAHEKHIEQLNEETEALKSVQSELESVRSELEATSSRMDELKSKGKLSFVEEEEYNRLQQITGELKRQEAILLAQEKRAKNKQVQAALNALKSDPNLRGYTDAASSYAAAQGQGTSTTIGAPYAAGLQNTNIPSTYTSDKNKYEINLQNLQEAKKELEEYETQLSKIDDAESEEYKDLETKVKNAKKRVEECNNAIDSMDEAWQKEYGEVGYIENATEDWEKLWNKKYREHQNYLMQQGFINGEFDKADVLDSTFGVYGTDAAQQFKKDFESAVKSGGDPTEVIEKMLNNQDYSSAFSGLEEQFGITMDNIKAYFTQTGEFKIDPEFSITKYSQDIKSHSAVISEFQEAIQKLGKGSFTMDDYLDLIERFPDLAKGVDISSNAFYGLSRNLNKAIKTRTKDFVDDLKDLKNSLIAAGKSTDSIDQLIEAIENMPSDALDDTIERYSTLAQKIDEARTAQDKLRASMEENPNEGYETRGEAMDYMKEAMNKGEIGSESNLWNVAKKYGFTYDSAKTINENADALAKFIAIREKWYAQDDDGDNRTNDGYSYEGTKNFIEAVESASQSETFQEALKKNLGKDSLDGSEFKWLYDENTGVLDFDFDNKNWDAIVAALSETEELAGLTSDEFSDMMVQIGQYHDVNWGDADDVNDHITKIAEGSGTASDKIEQMTDSVETYVEKVLGTDLDFSNLTEASIDAMTCSDSIKALLKQYLELKEAVLLAEENIDNANKKLKELGMIDTDFDIDSTNLADIEWQIGAAQKVLNKFIGTDGKVNVDAEGAKEAQLILEALIKQRQKLEQPVIMTVTVADYDTDTGDLIGKLQKFTEAYNNLEVQVAIDGDVEGAQAEVDTVFAQIQSTDPEVLAKLGIKPDSEENLKSQISALDSEVFTKLKLDPGDATTELNKVKEGVDAITTAVESIPDPILDPKQAVDAAGAITDAVVAIPDRTVYVDVVTRYSTSGEPSSSGPPEGFEPPPNLKNVLGIANGTANANGTAYKGGSWGAPRTETALVGELGPELIVRGSQWTTIGDNGAEFTQIKKATLFLIINRQKHYYLKAM